MDKASPLKQLVNFTSFTIGLEKTLRLIQALAQVAGELGTDEVLSAKCLIARDQLALGRRYFRLLDFYGCFERVEELVRADPVPSSLLKLMEIAEFTFLGLYLLLEDLTILHDMNVMLVSWYRPLLVEANKLWFYAIILSILRSVCRLFIPVSPQPSETGSNEKAKATEVALPSRTPLVKQIAVDACDLTLPGSFVGWLPVSDLQVGMAMVVSTILSAEEHWVKAQQTVH